MLSDLANTVAMTIGRITYRDALLYRSTMTDNGKGTLTRSAVPVPCKAQIDAITQGQRPEGWAMDDVRLLVLADGLSKWLDNGRLQDDDVVKFVGGEAYAVAGPEADPLGSHFICRGSLKPGWKP